MRLPGATVLAAALAVASGGGAAAQAPEPSGRIVFEAGHDTPSAGIHVVSADGRGDRQLAAPIYVSASVLDAARPEPSPQGDRVVFVRHAFGQATRRISTLSVVSLHGAVTPRSLGRGDFPSWSPDGRRIAYQRLGALHVVRADGTGLRRLARVDRQSFRRNMVQGEYVDLAPAWSPDGRELAFARAGEIWVARADRPGARRLTSSGTADAAPAWSPDGSLIAWICGGDVCAMRPDGTAKRWVTELHDSTAVVVRWSPGRARPRLAFVASGLGVDGYALYVTPHGPSDPRLVLAYDRTGYPDFAWSPDGRFLAFSHQRPVDGPFGREHRQQITVVSAEGGALRPVTSMTGWHPRWTR